MTIEKFNAHSWMNLRLYPFIVQAARMMYATQTVLFIVQGIHILDVPHTILFTVKGVRL